MTQGSATTTYGYDGLGRRVKRTYVNGTTTNTRYLWCGIAICQTRDGSDTVTAKLFAEGEYRPSGTKKYLYLTDHLGSVRDVVDITGTPTLVAAFDYTPYGAVARSWGSVVPSYTYAGLQAGPSGLLLSVTRAYSPMTGKFLNNDLIREFGGINLTGYTGGNPVGRSDRLGLAYSAQAIAPSAINISSTVADNWKIPKPTNALGEAFEKMSEIIGADSDFIRNYHDMREANTIGADKYFHCKAHCEATKRGPAGLLEASNIGELRELLDQYIKGDPREACDEDRRANLYGKVGALTQPDNTCAQICAPLRPRGLPEKY